MQIAEDDLLSTPMATLPAAAPCQLPRLPASTLTLPLAKQVAVDSQHDASIGLTVRLPDCPLESQQPLLLPQTEELQLPPSFGLKLPRIEVLAECRHVLLSRLLAHVIA